SGIYPSEIRAINIDSDWIFRKGAKTFLGLVDNPMYGFVNRVKIVFFERIPNLLIWFAENPPAALNIAANVMILPFFSSHKRREKKGEIEKMKAIHSRIQVELKPIGNTIIFVCVFFIIFLLAYYIANKDWQ
ncbi:MAG: hypothetical protein ACUZ8E_02830, partial [Candidatus Anammoxibacter sp.]